MSADMITRSIVSAKETSENVVIALYFVGQAQPDSERIQAGLAAGARSLMCDQDDANTVQAAFDIASRGVITVSSVLSEAIGLLATTALAERAAIKQRSLASGNLSVRQRQLLKLIGDGQSTAGAARSMSISRHTAAEYLKTVYRKLGVNSQAAAIAAAMRSGELS